jgi:hypothetical protein
MHLLRVASGLDSMVLGEPQILGQVKSAFQTACDCTATGKLLCRLFQHAFSVAKTVRTDTAIGSSPVSVAFAAVSLARQIFSDLSKQTALLIGAGETIELAARHLHQNGIGRIVVANRTVERAHELAAQFDGFAIALTEIANHLAEARHRHLLHRQPPAGARQGRGGAGAEGAPAPAHVHGGHRRPSGHRARGVLPERRLSLHGRRPPGGGGRGSALAPGGRRPGRGDHRLPRRGVHGLAALPGRRRPDPGLPPARRAAARRGAGAGAAPARRRQVAGRGPRLPGPHPHQQAAARPQHAPAPGRPRRRREILEAANELFQLDHGRSATASSSPR